MRRLTLEHPMSSLAACTESDMRLYFGVDERGTPSPYDQLAARVAFAPIIRKNYLWLPPTREQGGLDFSRAQPPVYVKTPSHAARVTDPVVAASEEESAQRRVRIGLQLEFADKRHEQRERAGPPPGAVLERFFAGSALHRLLVFGPYGVLADDTPEALEAHAKSRSKLDAGCWLRRQAERLESLRAAPMPRKPAERRALLTHRDALESMAVELGRAGEALLIEAGRRYEDAAREMPRAPRRGKR